MKLYFIFLFILFFVNMSCDIIHNSNDSNNKALQKTETGTNQLNLKYSDSIFKNSNGFGKINYDMSIKDIDDSNVLERYIILYTSVDENSTTFEEIEKTKQNAFIDTLGNGNFHFKYKFNKVGDKILKLAFEDLVVYIDSIKNRYNDKDKTFHL